MPTVQDLPPIGGYEPIQWKRHLPSRGFRPKVWLGLLFGICGYGFYKTIQSIHERRELQREKMWSRIYLMPLLQAEADREMVRRYYSDKAAEAKIMKDVEGWEVGKSVYNDGRFRTPAYSFADVDK